VKGHSIQFGNRTGISVAAILTFFLIASAPSRILAAVDTGDNPPCAQDGICNLAVCDADPDCPDLPPEAGAEPASTSNTTTITFGTISCSDAQDLDIRAVAWNLADDWTNFERAIESATGKNLGNCTQDRFTKNGKVECVAAYDCKTTKDGLQKCMLGYGWGLGKKIKLYRTFFDNVSGMSQPDRRACYAGLMAHEFAHTCEHYAERGPEARADAAVEYWKDRFSPTSTLNPQTGCGFND
jgi:hypothetical protein